MVPGEDLALRSRGAPGSMSPERCAPTPRDGADAFGDACRAGLAIFLTGSGLQTIVISPERSEMAIALPPTIERFIEASNSRDLEIANDRFAEEAVVEDEGRTHRGIVEVRAWKQATEERLR